MHTCNEEDWESWPSVWGCGVWTFQKKDLPGSWLRDKDLCRILPAPYHPRIEPFQSLEKDISVKWLTQ